MPTVEAVRAGPELIQRWRQQIGWQRGRRERRGPRPYAVISYVARGASQDGLIDLREVAFVVLQDARRQDGSLAIRFRSYAGSAASWGVRIGGAENNRFDKDLALAPKKNTQRQAFNFLDTEFLRLGLDLDRYLERRFRFPCMFRRTPRFPRLWAAFAREVARNVRCAGPEFEAAGCRPLSRTLSGGGAELFPVEYVSHEWRRITRLMVDLRGFSKRQLVPVDHRAAHLAGFTGAVEFDLRHSRFSPAEVA